jgi:hypothetical protein
MTPTPSTGRDPHDDDTVDRILAELRIPPDVDVAMTEPAPDETLVDGLDGALATLSIDALSADAQAAVERLLAGGEGLTPDARQRMINAAQRGLRRQRLSHGTLASLLAIRRDEHGLTAAGLARELHLDEADVLTIESGERDVRTLTATQIATWVSRLAIEPERAIQALRRSLKPASTAVNLAQRASPPHPTEDSDEALVVAVKELLQQRSQ